MHLGADRQRPLWASTGIKNLAYSDIRYVAELAGPDALSAMPEHTLRAVADHRQIDPMLDHEAGRAGRVPNDLAAAGIDLPATTVGLQRDGVQSFCDSYRQLSDCIRERADAAGACRTPVRDRESVRDGNG